MWSKVRVSSCLAASTIHDVVMANAPTSVFRFAVYNRKTYNTLWIFTASFFAAFCKNMFISIIHCWIAVDEDYEENELLTAVTWRKIWTQQAAVGSTLSCKVWVHFFCNKQIFANFLYGSLVVCHIMLQSFWLCETEFWLARLVFISYVANGLTDWPVTFISWRLLGYFHSNSYSDSSCSPRRPGDHETNSCSVSMPVISAVLSTVVNLFF